MYTECPECGIAFRVTASVLQQAKGNVRCGSCNHAFNALDYLSEEMPGKETAHSDDPEVDDLAETSKRLLETLDELAGPSNVHIEDTGIEWRVLQEDAVPDAPSDVDEPRYDDNSPLPEDADEEVSQQQEPPDIKESYDEPEEDAPHLHRRETDTGLHLAFNEMQGDLALSEPDEWTDLLDEVRDPVTDTLEVEEELAAIHSQLSGRESAPADNAERSVETDSKDSAASAPVLHDNVDVAPQSSEDSSPLDEETELKSADREEAIAFDNSEDSAVDDSADHQNEMFAAADEDDAETGDLFDTGNGADGIEFNLADIEDESIADQELSDDVNEDGELSIQSEADSDEQADDPMQEPLEDPSAGSDDDEIDESLGQEVDDESDVEAAAGELDDYDVAAESTDESADADESDFDDLVADNDGSTDDAEKDAATIDAVAEDYAEVDGAADASVDITEDQQDEKEEKDDEALLASESDSADDSDPVDDIEVPPQTEEEMTVNMEIDQEMMAMALQDDEFSATLVGIEPAAELLQEKIQSEEVETIIMEGETIHNLKEEERLAAEREARNETDDPASLVDTYAVSREVMRGGRRKSDPPGYLAISGAVVLAIILALQVIHYTREALATSDIFAKTIAPVYEMLGKPVTPNWNIKGWQFESTNGSVNDDDSALIIVSRLTNQTAEALPYPLVQVSLTDRWEDITGSRILEPGEYLADGIDPGNPVLPGAEFTAVINIESPDAETTGYRVRVCYRESAGSLRCADMDFKN